MERLRNAIIAMVQQEADTWAMQDDLHDGMPAVRAVAGFNECFPDNAIDIATEVEWHDDEDEVAPVKKAVPAREKD